MVTAPQLRFYVKNSEHSLFLVQMSSFRWNRHFEKIIDVDSATRRTGLLTYLFI